MKIIFLDVIRVLLDNLFHTSGQKSLMLDPINIDIDMLQNSGRMGSYSVDLFTFLLNIGYYEYF